MPPALSQQNLSQISPNDSGNWQKNTNRRNNLYSTDLQKFVPALTFVFARVHKHTGHS